MSRRFPHHLAAVALIATTAAGRLNAQAVEPFEERIRPLLREYCFDCHGGTKAKGDLDLERIVTGADARREPKVWQAVAEQLAAGEMPPRDKPQPAAADRDRLLGWTDHLLNELAQAQAGDPGPVVLRRLSNAEYTYTVQDLTGIAALDPAREFPVDGAAGEGFMNTGSALVMSPTLLTKYLDAAREVAEHLVLLPDGIGFSAATSRRDRTEELLGRIREFYRRFTDSGGGSRVNLQGIVFETNAGGRLPIERYLTALLEERIDGTTPSAGISRPYLDRLRAVLERGGGSPILAPLRTRWRTATPADVPELVSLITAWQRALWRFQSVGHIGKVGGPTAWQEPVVPIVSRREFRIPLPPPGDDGAVTLRLSAGDAGDGSAGDIVRWENPRFTAPGRPDLSLRDVRATTARRLARRQRLFGAAAAALAAASEVLDAPVDSPPEPEPLAARHGLTTDEMNPWFEILGLRRPDGPTRIGEPFTGRLEGLAGRGFLNGWGFPETPSAVANASDEEVRIPGRLPGHRLAVHPSPALNVVAAWRCPLGGQFQVTAAVQHAHPECGNGVTWSLELRQGGRMRRLAAGIAQGERALTAGPFEGLTVRPGDVLALVVGPRDGNHSCDLTLVDLTIRSTGLARTWDLATDLSGNILAGNPHADSEGRPDVWHLVSEPVSGETRPDWAIPSGSLLDRWLAAGDAGERARLAAEFQQRLAPAPPPSGDSPDSRLLASLAALDGPLLATDRVLAADLPADLGTWGPDPALFGPRLAGSTASDSDLVMPAPGHLDVRVPGDLVSGREFVVAGMLDAPAGRDGSVQLQVVTGTPTGGTQRSRGTDDSGGATTSEPVVVDEGSAARTRFLAAFDEFRDLFPAALCYEKIVPVDEVVTLTLHYREDHHLRRLLLDQEEAVELDRLWDELHYVSQDAIALVDAYDQLWQFATQDADPSAFEPLREPIRRRAAEFRRRLIETEPAHLDGIVQFAAQAWRRPLSAAEEARLRGFYASLRTEEIPHDEAVRYTLARILTAPGFLYHMEEPGPGAGPGPVSDWELASRLSYFLWSGPPDERLRQQAAAGRLGDSRILAAEARRMVSDPRIRRWAVEFGCAWLQIHGFDALDEKSERHFPTFAAVRRDLYEEAIRFLTDFLATNQPVTALLDSDHTFLNDALAAHYSIPGITGPEWRRVDGIRSLGRGGILGLGAVLAKQSGASRTSPILRGNWLCEVVLGEKLPRPPAGVPVLPEDEAETEGSTVRELVERHSRDPKCAACHVRIDPYGFALEAFDAIGRRRDRDMGNRPIATQVRTLSGAEFEGLEGLREHLLIQRRNHFTAQFCRKLLGYALGRSVQLSDRPLLTRMRTRSLEPGAGVADVVELLVTSRQFREIRGIEARRED